MFLHKVGLVVGEQLFKLLLEGGELLVSCIFLLSELLVSFLTVAGGLIAAK